VRLGAGGSARRRVLVLSENLSVPFDRRVWQESRALARAGYEVTVICPRGRGRDQEPEARIDGVRILRFPLREASGGRIGFVREYALALWHMARLSLPLGRFDAVHATNPPDLLFVVALAHRLRGARFVFDHHDLAPELYRSRFDRGPDAVFRLLLVLEGLTFRLADLVIATNDSYRQVALSRGRRRPEDVVVVRSGPSADRFPPARPDPGLRRGRPHLLCYLGVMGPQDGVDCALRALARLRDELGRADWHAVFVGGGESQPEMVRLAGRLGLEDLVTFTGRVSDGELARCLATADVCLAPDPPSPLNDVSTMTKVMEYMAMGRPIVSFDLRETRVSAGDAALYADDEGDFARLVARLLDDPAERARMGAAGRERVRADLSWEHSEAALVEAYGRLLAARAKGAPRGPKIAAWPRRSP
jgi:glycosyltransferase involved in cell wall biosynthesis